MAEWRSNLSWELLCASSQQKRDQPRAEERVPFKIDLVLYRNNLNSIEGQKGKGTLACVRSHENIATFAWRGLATSSRCGSLKGPSLSKVRRSSSRLLSVLGGSVAD